MLVVTATVLGPAVIAACAALVAAGVAMIVRWGGPAPRGGLPAPRELAVLLAAGAGAGAIAAGAGGRLVMRMLALTSPDALGALTEAEATIGEITVAGTLGFLLFAGIPAGVLTAVLYACGRPLLPPGRRGGALLGLLVLVLAGATLEPLRADNFDFRLVGPDWLSVSAFAALAAFQGMLVVALGQRLAPPRAAAPRRAALIAGRVVAVALVLATLPGFAAAVTDILSA